MYLIYMKSFSDKINNVCLQNYVTPLGMHMQQFLSPNNVDIPLKRANIQGNRWKVKGMRNFNYSLINERKWDSETLGLVAAIY